MRRSSVFGFGTYLSSASASLENASKPQTCPSLGKNRVYQLCSEDSDKSHSLTRNVGNSGMALQPQSLNPISDVRVPSQTDTMFVYNRLATWPAQSCPFWPPHNTTKPTHVIVSGFLTHPKQRTHSSSTSRHKVADTSVLSFARGSVKLETLQDDARETAVWIY